MKNYYNNVVLRAKKELSIRSKIKFILVGILLLVLVLTGAAMQLDADLIHRMGEAISIDDFKTQMESMKDGSTAGELVTGIRSYSSVDYEFEILTMEENEQFVDDLTELFLNDIAEFQ